MSIDMILGSARSQTNSIKSLTTKQIASYEEIERALTNFVTQTHNLKGVTYDSAKAYCSSVLTPVIRGSILLDQAIARANEQYINTYTGEVHNDSLKQSELERAIEDTKSQIAFNERLLNEHFEQDAVDLREVSNLQDKISSYRKIQHDLEEKLRKLLAFNAKSPSFFQEIESLKNAVDQGMAIANKSWSPFSKTFSIPKREDMGWTDIIEGKWEEKDYSQDDLNYKESLKVQYGFDDKTSRIIVKLKRNIYKDSRIKDDEKDYVLTRLLGGLVYGHDENDLLNKFMWFHTAGGGKLDLRDPTFGLSIKEQLKKYGDLTDSEYNYLKYKVRIQQANYGNFAVIKEKYSNRLFEFKNNMETALGYKISDGEFEALWNKQIDAFKGKTDFSHQYITMATHLYGRLRLADFKGGYENTNDMSGWLGDTTNIAEVEPSIGNDDYKADLDSVNITSIMKKDNIGFIEASNKYYNNLENGTYNRAEEFKKNIPLNKVEDKIFEQLRVYYVDKDNRPVNKPSTIDDIQKNYPQTYNFIKSLENNKNDLKNYNKE
ncbi:T7SS effector LXG polymorphic toxin [Gemella sanguinis]|uniref:T7SS effector LXG polymorphic toxin n=1 Tax=Gemella sanguinis TaxID=84135 RepID=UPI00352D5E4C